MPDNTQHHRAQHTTDNHNKKIYYTASQCSLQEHPTEHHTMPQNTRYHTTPQCSHHRARPLRRNPTAERWPVGHHGLSFEVEFNISLSRGCETIGHKNIWCLAKFWRGDILKCFPFHYYQHMWHLLDVSESLGREVLKIWKLLLLQKKIWASPAFLLSQTKSCRCWRRVSGLGLCLVVRDSRSAFYLARAKLTLPSAHFLFKVCHLIQEI